MASSATMSCVASTRVANPPSDASAGSASTANVARLWAGTFTVLVNVEPLSVRMVIVAMVSVVPNFAIVW